ncbi:MAG: TonB-dependent receptor, partial [Chitinophagaceae bacterium]
KKLSLYASYSQGYKAPVSAYFFIPFTGEVNMGLEPEKGVQYEVGSKGSLLGDKLSYDLAFFQANYQNKMAAVAVPNAAGTATAYSYIVNSGEQNNKGFEAALRYTVYNASTGLFRMIRPFVNATYSDFTYKNYKFQTNALLAPINYDGLQVAGFPKKVVNAGLDINADAYLPAPKDAFYFGGLNIRYNF